MSTGNSAAITGERRGNYQGRLNHFTVGKHEPQPAPVSMPMPCSRYTTLVAGGGVIIIRTLYVSVVILCRKYTGALENDPTASAVHDLLGGDLAHAG